MELQRDEKPDNSLETADDAKRIEVDLSEDRDDDEPNAAATENEGTRKSRREQFREFRETTRRSEERAAAAERQLAELRGRVDAMSTRTADNGQPRTDPQEEQIDGLWRQQQLLLAQIRNPSTADTEAEKLQTEWRKLDRQRRKMELKVDAKDVIPASDAPSQRDYENQILASEYPRVFNDTVAMEEARVEMMKLVRQGKPVSIVTAREAAKRVDERTFGRRPAPPTDSERARHTSVPGQAGSNGGRQTFSPSSTQLRTARAFTAHLPDISDEERVRIWANKVGKKHGLV